CTLTPLRPHYALFEKCTLTPLRPHYEEMYSDTITTRPTILDRDNRRPEEGDVRFAGFSAS
ncbi:MAG: hypothetical protein KJO09_04740, partial [Gammaproteobacteria bacterium]|nr:hypothetical protein [Gammaproteobacteria bacterium]